MRENFILVFKKPLNQKLHRKREFGPDGQQEKMEFNAGLGLKKTLNVYNYTFDELQGVLISVVSGPAVA